MSQALKPFAPFHPYYSYHPQEKVSPKNKLPTFITNQPLVVFPSRLSQGFIAHKLKNRQQKTTIAAGEKTQSLGEARNLASQRFFLVGLVAGGCYLLGGRGWGMFRTSCGGSDGGWSMLVELLQKSSKGSDQVNPSALGRNFSST